MTCLGSSDSGSLMRLQSWCQPGMQSSEGLPVAARSLPRLQSDSGCWQEASFPFHVDLPGAAECHHALAAAFPQSRRSKREQSKSYNALMICCGKSHCAISAIFYWSHG